MRRIRAAYACLRGGHPRRGPLRAHNALVSAFLMHSHDMEVHLLRDGYYASECVDFSAIYVDVYSSVHFSLRPYFKLGSSNCNVLEKAYHLKL